MRHQETSVDVATVKTKFDKSDKSEDDLKGLMSSTSLDEPFTEKDSIVPSPHTTSDQLISYSSSVVVFLPSQL